MPQPSTKLRVRRSSFRVPIYEDRVTVLVTPNVPALLCELDLQRDKDPKDENEYVGWQASTEAAPGKGFEIVLGENCPPGLVAHEALHVVIRMLYGRNMSLTADSEEAFTYLHEWLVNRIHKCLKD